jgi:hypothetical protein
LRKCSKCSCSLAAADHLASSAFASSRRAKAQLYCSSRLSGWQHIWQHHGRANFAVTWGKGVTTASPAHCIHRSADLSTSRRGYCWRCRRCNHCCRQCNGFMHCRPCRGALENNKLLTGVKAACKVLQALHVVDCLSSASQPCNTRDMSTSILRTIASHTTKCFCILVKHYGFNLAKTVAAAIVRRRPGSSQCQHHYWASLIRLWPNCSPAAIGSSQCVQCWWRSVLLP